MRTIDDRGRPAHPALPAAEPDLAIEELLIRIESEQTRPARERKSASLTLPLAFGCLILFVVVAFTGDLIGTLIAAAISAATIGIAIHERRTQTAEPKNVPNYHDIVRREVIRAHFCPSCSYRLRGVPPEPDGCTVCPECGAAWRLPDEEIAP